MLTTRGDDAEGQLGDEGSRGRWAMGVHEGFHDPVGFDESRFTLCCHADQFIVTAYICLHMLTIVALFSLYWFID